MRVGELLLSTGTTFSDFCFLITGPWQDIVRLDLLVLLVVTADGISYRLRNSGSSGLS